VVKLGNKRERTFIGGAAESRLVATRDLEVAEGDGRRIVTPSLSPLISFIVVFKQSRKSAMSRAWTEVQMPSDTGVR